MRVYSNTSPLSNLALVGRLRLLWSFYESVTIPEAVWTELEDLRHEAALAALQQAREAGKIAVKVVSERALVLALSLDLHAGESEAIALAVQDKADLLLMDEREGRTMAARQGIELTGVLGVLRRAKVEGLIPSLRTEIAKLREVAHFFVAPRLEDVLLRSVGELA